MSVSGVIFIAVMSFIVVVGVMGLWFLWDVSRIMELIFKNICSIRVDMANIAPMISKLDFHVRDIDSNTKATSLELPELREEAVAIAGKIEELTKKFTVESFRQTVQAEKHGGRTSKGENALKIIAANRELANKED